MHFPIMSDLLIWMQSNAKDDKWLADALGCDRTQASKIRRRRSRPSPERAFLIENLTRGKVKASALLAPLTTPSQGEAA